MYLVKLLTQSGIIERIVTEDTLQEVETEIYLEHGTFITLSSTKIETT